MKTKNTNRIFRYQPISVAIRLIIALILIVLAGIFGDSSGLGFSGLLMIAGVVVAMFGLYAENDLGYEDTKGADGQFIYLPHTRQDNGIISNFYFGRVFLGLGLFLLGILVGVIGLTITQIFVTTVVLILANLLYAVRLRTMYSDALKSEVRSTDRLALNEQETDAVDLDEDDEQLSSKHQSS